MIPPARPPRYRWLLPLALLGLTAALALVDEAAWAAARVVS